jgi:ribosomal protein L32
MRRETVKETYTTEEILTGANVTVSGIQYNSTAQRFYGNIYTFNVYYTINYCPNCGKRVLPEWNYCPYCGYPLAGIKKYLNIQNETANKEGEK